MIESVMYFGIGFLVAALLGLLFVPLVHNRAVRLTMKRLEASTPLSIAEIRADKDQLRAEFAMSTRRLEMSVEKMKAKTTTQLAELGKKTDAINQLKKELGEKTATIFALEARDKTLRDQLRATEEEFQIKSGGLRDAERQLADKETDLSKLLGDLGERSLVADNQRGEISALRAQVEALRASVADYERAVAETEHRLEHERSDAEVAGKELTEARARVGDLGTRVSELERQLFVQQTEAEVLNRRVHELETRLADQGRLLAERDYQLDRTRSELEAAVKTEADLRSELAATGNRSNSAVDRFRSEITQLEAQLAVAIEDRNKLQREIGTMKRDAESTWAAERVENALLRERINDVAAATDGGTGGPRLAD
jgi:chromosome segregation ATPase